jgi:hypothetical protein
VTSTAIHVLRRHAGIGASRARDTIDIEITGIGTLSNPVVREG